MSTECWSKKNQFLNAIQRTLIARTHRRLTGLDVDWEDDEIIVEADCESYYAVQLALAAMQSLATYSSEETPPIRLEFRISGRLLKLNLPRTMSASTQCRREPTSLRSATAVWASLSGAGER